MRSGNSPRAAPGPPWPTQSAASAPPEEAGRSPLRRSSQLRARPLVAGGPASALEATGSRSSSTSIAVERRARSRSAPSPSQSSLRRPELRPHLSASGPPSSLVAPRHSPLRAGPDQLTKGLGGSPGRPACRSPVASLLSEPARRRSSPSSFLRFFSTTSLARLRFFSSLLDHAQAQGRGPSHAKGGLQLARLPRLGRRRLRRSGTSSSPRASSSSTLLLFELVLFVPAVN